MVLDKVKRIISEKINQEADIVFITKTGSHLFCSNCKDIDYKVIVKNNLPKEVLHYYDKETSEDYFIHSIDEYNSMLNYEKSNLNTLFMLDDLFKEQYCVYGDKTVNLKLLENADKFKKMLRELLPKSFFNPMIRWNGCDVYCHRHLWWAIIGLKFIDNNSYEITDEIKNIIQQCHDGVLDKSWEEYVKDKISI